MNADSKTFLFKSIVWLIVAALVVGLVFWAIEKILGGLGKFNPTSDKNIFYQGANSIVQALTGDKNATVGTALYNATHSDSNPTDDVNKANQTGDLSYLSASEQEQAVKTCNVLLARNGSVKSPICIALQAAGKLNVNNVGFSSPA